MPSDLFVGSALCMFSLDNSCCHAQEAWRLGMNHNALELTSMVSCLLVLLEECSLRTTIK